ncbi:MAG TPA: AMP-binding protein [Tahibacter sp.]|uniref:AMP-binding protein n=1 Tax=Tahibacter sp. TaxID=2056211 RepID=UPI002B9587A5|nr:AMP-binding protein [Tahibacter sp.]HSX59328.1 AMP-binding protein [Tahibacter sp.]
MKKPIWEPSAERVERANLSRFVRFAREQTGNDDLRGYAAIYDFSIHHPERFWPLVWEFCGIRSIGTFHDVIVAGEHVADTRWFPGVRLNVAQNLLRYRDDRAALIARDADGRWQETSYAQLQQQVARIAAALRESGIKPGDRVVGLLDHGSEAVVAMLASVAVGAVWSALPPHADAASLNAALRTLAPRAAFATGAVFARAELGLGFDARIAVGGPAANAAAWSDLLARDAAPLTFEASGFEQPLYALLREDGDISLHSAGGTLIQHLKDLVLHVDLKRDDRVLHAAAPHTAYWHWLTSALAAGSTLVLSDATFDPAHASAWDLVDEQAVSVIATDTAALARFAASPLQPRETHKLLTLKTVLANGPSPAGNDIEQVYARVKDRLMVSACGGDAGGLSFLALGCPLLPVYADELQCRALGMRVEMLGDAGSAVIEEPGTLACLAPFPGLPLGFVDDADDARFRTRYFSQHAHAWCSGERAVLTAREGVQFETRTDGQP